LDSRVGAGVVAAAVQAAAAAKAAGYSDGLLEPLFASVIAVAVAGPLVAQAAEAANALPRASLVPIEATVGIPLLLLVRGLRWLLKGCTALFLPGAVQASFLADPTRAEVEVLATRLGLLLSDALVWAALTVAQSFDYGHSQRVLARHRPRRPLWEHPVHWWAWMRHALNHPDAPPLLPPAQAAAAADAAALAALAARDEVDELTAADSARLLELRDLCSRKVTWRHSQTP
jgi:hypothetical protein